MRLQIEGWANDNLEKNAIELMNEAVLCYKVGAYKAAYLLSYLAFKTTIRGRIIGAPRPEGVSEECWKKQIIECLEDDNGWENELNNFVYAAKEEGRGKAALFRFSNYERIKNRYEYWKNIRNSCAHAKEEHISACTVEQFWNYMQDDLPEYYVTGGKGYLLENLCHSYKFFASVGKERVQHILKDIAIVYKKSANQCFELFYEKNKSHMCPAKDNVEFWKIIICTENDVIREAYTEFLLQHFELFIEWYEEFPQLFTMMADKNETFVQEYVSPWLVKGWFVEGSKYWKLLAAVLGRNANLIDLDLVTSQYFALGMIEDIQLSQEELVALHENKVFKCLLFKAGKEYFINDANSHWSYYSFNSGKRDAFSERCFEYVEWDIDIVNKLNLSYKELEENIVMRENESSKNNGNRRKVSYDKVIGKHNVNIITAIYDAKKEVEDYPFIESSLRRQGLYG